MQLESIIFLFFLFLLTPINAFINKFFLSIHSSPMFIINMFFHTCVAMCRIIKKNTFLQSCCAITIRSWNHEVAQYAPHALSEMVMGFCSKIIEHKKCPYRKNSIMAVPQLLVLLQLKKQHPFHFNVDPFNCNNMMHRCVGDVGDINELH